MFRIIDTTQVHGYIAKKVNNRPVVYNLDHAKKSH